MKKRIIAAVLLLLTLTATAIPAFASPPMRSYLYTPSGNAVPTPTAYKFDSDITGSAYGIGDFTDPSDMMIDSDNYIYVLDCGNSTLPGETAGMTSKNGRVIIFNQDKELVRVLDEENVIYNGEKLKLSGSPESLFVWEQKGEKYLYVADTKNSRIVRINLAGQLDGQVEVNAEITVDRVYGAPKIDLLQNDVVWQPSKFIVDRAQRLFVVAKNINRGLVKLTPDGEFSTFFGVPDVSMSAIERFWRKISTKEQLSQMEQLVPTEYSNITLDDSGFIYTTISAISASKVFAGVNSSSATTRTENAVVLKLAANGVDVLSRVGYFPPVGDISNQRGKFAISSFVDVCVNEYDIYSTLDSQRGRVFTYDQTGELLFVFGNIGQQDGTFQKPVALGYFMDDQIAVLDSRTKAISFMRPTDYAKTILAAVKAYKKGNYTESEAMWQRVLEMNSNMIQAYSGVGKSLLRAGEYEKAMEYFKIAMDTSNYSKALDRHLSQIIGNIFPYIFIGLILLFFATKAKGIYTKVRNFFKTGVKKVV